MYMYEWVIQYTTVVVLTPVVSIARPPHGDRDSYSELTEWGRKHPELQKATPTYSNVREQLRRQITWNITG